MTTRKKVAVLISGRGSNLQALIDACRPKHFPAEIVLVISNVADAPGLERAAQAKIPTQIVSDKDTAALETSLDKALKAGGIDIVCLAGFMRVLSADFVKRWEGKILNIHPSLLPAFKGLHVHEQALKAGVAMSGCTVHFVTSDLDGGPNIAQASVNVFSTDTPETLAARVLEAEHRIYPAALKRVAEGQVALIDGAAKFFVQKKGH